MDIQEIIDYLEENSISEVEEVKSDSESFVIKFYYDFDSEEISAARAYANEESDAEEESEEWYRDWYLSYLYDLAKDNLDEIFEDMNEEFNTSSFMKVISDDASNVEYLKFVAIICSDDFDKDLEEELNDYL